MVYNDTIDIKPKILDLKKKCQIKAISDFYGTSRVTFGHQLFHFQKKIVKSSIRKAARIRKDQRFTHQSKDPR